MGLKSGMLSVDKKEIWGWNFISFKKAWCLDPQEVNILDTEDISPEISVKTRYCGVSAGKHVEYWNWSIITQ
jgi:hypothetical protein